jgi:hypothetical protein
MNNRYFSDKQEKNIAKAVKGKKQPNSGATMFRKGDVISDHFLIEAKTVTKEQTSFMIKKEWLDKLKEEQFAMRKPYSALAFNFGTLENQKNLYIIDERTFKVFIELLEKEDE